MIPVWANSGTFLRMLLLEQEWEHTLESLGIMCAGVNHKSGECGLQPRMLPD